MALLALGHVPWLLRSKEKRETGLLLELKPPYVTQWLQPFLRLKALKKETHFESVSFSKCWLPFQFCLLLFTLKETPLAFWTLFAVTCLRQGQSIRHLLSRSRTGTPSQLNLEQRLKKTEKSCGWFLPETMFSGDGSTHSQGLLVHVVWNLALETSLWSCVVPQ